MSEKKETGDAIVWVLPDYLGAVADREDMINARLAEDGYSYQVSFQLVSDADYNSTLREMLKRGETDIAFLGFASWGYVETTPVDLMRDGTVEDLSDYLQSETGKALYESYEPEIWEMSQVDGKQYFIPSENMGCGMMYLAFNRAYFSDEDVEEYDGSVESLIALVKEHVSDEVTYPLLWNCGSGMTANWCGFDEQSGAWTSLETGEAVNPLKEEEVLRFIDQTHEAEAEGIIRGIDGDQTLLEVEKSRDFGVIAYVSGDSSINTDSEDIILQKAKYALFTSTSVGTGICAASEKKDDALALLTLFHLDAEYANLLVLGEEGTDYQLLDGYVYDMEGNEPSVSVKETCTGVFDLVYPTEESLFAGHAKQTKKDFLASDCLQDNVLIGCILEYRDEEIPYADLYEFLYFCVTPTISEYEKPEYGISIDKNDYASAEEWISEAIQCYEKMGGKKVLKDFNEQIDEFMQASE